MDWVIVDQNEKIIAGGFNTHKDALEFMKKLDLSYVNKIRLHIAERN